MATFKLIAPDTCTYARAHVGERLFQFFPGHGPLTTPQRCRQCGQRMPAGTPAVHFYHNFSEWTHWMFTAYIHAEPCQAPPQPRQRARRITILPC